jgi:hypothetical protein
VRSGAADPDAPEPTESRPKRASRKGKSPDTKSATEPRQPAKTKRAPRRKKGEGE